jgi:hypothetical protein
MQSAIGSMLQNPGNLYAKLSNRKAEDFAPVALFIHFQMNHLAEISRPRKTWLVF